MHLLYAHVILLLSTANNKISLLLQFFKLKNIAQIGFLRHEIGKNLLLNTNFLET